MGSHNISLKSFLISDLRLLIGFVSILFSFSRISSIVSAVLNNARRLCVKVMVVYVFIKLHV